MRGSASCLPICLRLRCTQCCSATFRVACVYVGRSGAAAGSPVMPHGWLRDELPLHRPAFFALGSERGQACGHYSSNHVCPDGSLNADGARVRYHCCHADRAARHLS